MPNPELFLDTSALFSGVISSGGAARALLVLAQIEKINITISMQVTAEMERTLVEKAPEAIGKYRQILKDARIRVLPNPTPQEIAACGGMISHTEDIPILAVAISCKTDYFVTHNTKHFIANPEVSNKSGVRIGSPGDALMWVRRKFGE